MNYRELEQIRKEFPRVDYEAFDVTELLPQWMKTHKVTVDTEGRTYILHRHQDMVATRLIVAISTREATAEETIICICKAMLTGRDVRLAYELAGV